MACKRDHNGREPLDDLVVAEILEGKDVGESLIDAAKPRLEAG